MNLKEIAAVSGKGGLFKVLKPTRTGVILESIDESKTKLVANANSRVSILKEISVYTTSKESSIPLENVFQSISEKYGKKLNVSAKSEEKELTTFLLSVVPDYDRERVYISDIKKIVSWYTLLANHVPEVFEQTEEKEEPKKESKAKAEKEEKKTSAKGDEEKPKAKAKSPAKKKSE